MNEYLDHVIWICDNLERGVRRFEEITGVAARFGGVHASGLTHNALVGLGPRRYLEILAPTGPAGAADDEWSRLARTATQPRLLTYCMRTPQPLAALASKAHELGFTDSPVTANARTTPEGVRLRWQWVQPRSSRFDLAFPFFIDWLDSAHPAQTKGAALSLKGFSVGHPQAIPLQEVLAQLGTPVDLYAAPALEFRLELNTPRGVVTL